MPLAPNASPRTSFFAILLVIFCTLLTSAGQLLLKIGTQNLQPNWQALITNYALIGGIVLYGLGAVVLIIALKHGELSILYPFIALSFIWVMILSIFILHEQVVAWNWIGVFFILCGVSFIGKGGSVEPQTNDDLPKLGRKGEVYKRHRGPA